MDTLNNIRLERAPGQVVRIELGLDANPNMTVSQLFEYGPIEILLMQSGKDKALFQVTSPYNLSVTPVEIHFKDEGDRLI